MDNGNDSDGRMMDLEEMYREGKGKSTEEIIIDKTEIDCKTPINNDRETVEEYESCINKVNKKIIDTKIINDIDRII